YKTPTVVPARRYIELLMHWIHEQLNNPEIFPIKPGNSLAFAFSNLIQSGDPFPDNFQSVAKNIFKRVFRVYGHVYHCHLKEVVGAMSPLFLRASKWPDIEAIFLCLF